MARKRLEAFHHLLAMRQIALFIHPASWPLFEVWAISCKLIWRRSLNIKVAADSAFALDFAPMRLITLLNHRQHFPGFVYEKARLCPESSTIEIHVRPRRCSKPVFSGCHKPAAGYDQLSIRRFEFVPFWGFMVLLLYRMRRVDCRACGVQVEELPWAIGKHQLTKAYMLFLATGPVNCLGKKPP